MNRLTLRDVMTRDYVGVNESDPLLDAIRLMREEDATSAVVLRGDAPVGVVTPAGVMDLVLDGTDPSTVDVTAAMNAAPPALEPSAPVTAAATRVVRTGDGRVLVADDEGVVGVVEARDLAAAVTEQPEPTQEGGPTRSAGETDVVDVYAGEASAQYASAESDDEYEGAPADDYAQRSICEACGSLARELTNVNGQLLCPDCRSV